MLSCLLADRPLALEAMKATEEEACNRHSTLTRSDVAQWNPTDEEWATYEFHDGYLVICVDNVFVDDIVDEDGERTWYVSASIYTGDEILGDPDLYSAYKCDNGEWIVEWDSC
jgi:hypothetical protein